MGKTTKRMVWFGLIAIVFFAGFARFNLLNVPLERDEGEYAYVAQLILQGVPPYREVNTIKFPGIYLIYSLFLLVFGQTHQGIHAALLVTNAITTIIVFLLAKQLCRSVPGALVSSAAFVLLSVSQSVEGIFANAEHFVIMFGTGGLYMMFRALDTKNLWRFFSTGILLGIAVSIKQQGIAFVILAVLFIFFDIEKQRPLRFRQWTPQLMMFFAGLLAIFAGYVVLLISAGVFDRFWFWTINYAHIYVSQFPAEQAWESFVTSAKPIILSAPLLWAFIVFGFAALVLTEMDRRYKVFLAMFTALSFLSICPGFYFRRHYFMLMLPCAALLAGISTDYLQNLLSKQPSKSFYYGISILLISACFGQSLYRQRAFLFKMTPFEISRSTYSLNPFPESLKIAAYINRHTNSQDRIAILGSEPQIFFYSRRRSASAYIYMYPLMEHQEFALQMQKEFIKDIEQKRPEYVVLINLPCSWVERSTDPIFINQWFDNYQRSHLRLVGAIELFHKRANYYWEPKVFWPVRSQYWVAVFKQIHSSRQER